MEFKQCTLLLIPEELPYLSGIERLGDGVLHVAVLTRMPGVTPQMIEWWFGEYMQTTEHYKRWHPRDHVWMEWEDKQPGTHVGAKHCVKEYIGGQLHHLKISFVPHQEYFDDALASFPGTVAICGRPGLSDRAIDTGRMIHLARPTEWGCELHSRFWLGYVHSRAGNKLVERLGNSRWLRHRLANERLGRALLNHCHEEMTNLAGFLPRLYADEMRMGNTQDKTSAPVTINPL